MDTIDPSERLNLLLTGLTATVKKSKKLNTETSATMMNVFYHYMK